MMVQCSICDWVKDRVKKKKNQKWMKKSRLDMNKSKKGILENSDRIVSCAIVFMIMHFIAINNEKMQYRQCTN